MGMKAIMTLALLAILLVHVHANWNPFDFDNRDSAKQSSGATANSGIGIRCCSLIQNNFKLSFNFTNINYLLKSKLIFNMIIEICITKLIRI